MGGVNAWKKADKPLEQKKDVKQITWAEYEIAISKNPTVLVNIGAEWCPPCKKMSPLIDSLAAAGESKFALVKIDGSQQLEISKQLNVLGFPTFIIYKKGKEVWRKQGVVDAAEISENL